MPSFFEGRRHDGQAVSKSLDFPLLDDSLREIAKSEPETEVIGIAIIVPNAGSTIDPEFGMALSQVRQMM